LHDNHSTDDTVKKARDRGCSVEKFGLPGVYEEKTLIELKNTCYLGGISDYVIVCDIDEFLDLNDDDLITSTPTLVQSWCWQMFNPKKVDIDKIKYGSRDWYYDKTLCFKRSEIAEINYQPGAHFCNPKLTSEKIRTIKIRRNMFHYRWLSFDHVVERYSRNSKRLGPSNYEKISQWHWDADEKSLQKQYRHVGKTSVRIQFSWYRKSRIRFLIVRHCFAMFRYGAKSISTGYGKEALEVLTKDLSANLVDLKRYYFPRPWL
jgi:hypothetical protein